MKVCPTCGIDNPDTAYCCSNCSVAFGSSNIIVQQQKYGAPYIMPKNNGMAIASMILGIASIACCGIAGILAVIFGFISNEKIKESNGTELGSGMAKAGIICGFIGIALWIIFLVFYILLVVLDFNASGDINTYPSV